MKINVSHENDDKFALIDVSDDIEYENFKALCAAEFGFEGTDSFSLVWNGNLLSEIGSKALRSLGVGDNDMVLVRPRVGNSNSQNQLNMDSLRSMLGSNPQQLERIKQQFPELANAIERGDQAQVISLLNMLMSGSRQPVDDMPVDPLDPAYQEKLYEHIRQQNVAANYESAMEHSPESFGHVVMLYINCKINGEPVKAFVDSGAQMTIMSKACAERCHLMKLLDTRFAGIAKGIGVQKILGRVHLGQLQIGDDYLTCTFSVLEDQEMDCLIGLDMLKRHQCSIDLKKNVLLIGTTGNETPFLPESELPKYARLNHDTTESERQQLEAKLKAAEAYKNGNGEQPSTSSQRPATAVASGSSNSNVSDKAVEEIVKRGFTRAEATEALSKYNGDTKKALANLLVSRLGRPSSAKTGPR